MQDSLRSASQTALMVAALRGQASNRADAICADPWAEALAGADGQAVADVTAKHFPYMGLWIALRTRYLDDCVRAYSAEGYRQVVVLGAGLDTRAARLKQADQTYFEVDHPASQEDKFARLQSLGEYPLDAATRVSCDFEHESFMERLVASGFQTDVPAIIVWEGVLYYLPEAAVRHTLSQISSQAHPESVLLFDYLSRNLVESQRVSESDEALVNELTGLGEPLRFGINDPVPLLNETGFRFVRTASFDEICLGVTGTYDRKRMFRFQHMAHVSCARDVTT
jgi:methyltransferase (TIGR00027 family)